MNEKQQPIVIDMRQLAELVGGHLRSCCNAFYLCPQNFPPALYLPGCRGPRFLMSDVHIWLESRKVAKAPSTDSTASRPRGRPRISTTTYH
ncbi:hypothetical protein JKG47_19655, partial [Acidithiobacillus sp. MC6.1]|nr:hypothetical protein [Acidithiobacillus sp. MC6.1]